MLGEITDSATVNEAKVEEAVTVSSRIVMIG
jgi:hypothetical protein